MYLVAPVCLPVCLSVRVRRSVCPARALTLVSLELETSEYLGQICMSRSSGQDQGRRSKQGIYDIIRP